MNYYRIAKQEYQTSKWIWKSTIVTSLESVFRLLRIYSPVPAERIRVFSSTCKEEMAEMLNRENDGLISGSRTAGEFLRERRLIVRDASFQETGEKKSVRRSTSVAVDTSCREERPLQPAFMNNAGFLDQRRLQIELGAGGDHDTSYSFSLPMSITQMLAWAQLFVRVQAGELQP